jgi:hypothetical protein
MLASTMQFSNNQHSRKHHRSLKTQQRARHGQLDNSVFHAEAVLTEYPKLTMPNSQRSTHEQPPQDTRLRHGLPAAYTARNAP